ncbi:hypothetical protein U1Q18_013940 [Sarracenia purpurea var. burkii]
MRCCSRRIRSFFSSLSLRSNQIGSLNLPVFTTGSVNADSILSGFVTAGCFHRHRLSFILQYPRRRKLIPGNPSASRRLNSLRRLSCSGAISVAKEAALAPSPSSIPPRENRSKKKRRSTFLYLRPLSYKSFLQPLQAHLGPFIHPSPKHKTA